MTEDVRLEGYPKNRCRIKMHVLIEYSHCGGQLYPVLKPRWKRPGPVSDLICTGCVRRGQAQHPI